MFFEEKKSFWRRNATYIIYTQTHTHTDTRNTHISPSIHREFIVCLHDCVTVYIIFIFNRFSFFPIFGLSQFALQFCLALGRKWKCHPFFFVFVIFRFRDTHNNTFSRFVPHFSRSHNNGPTIHIVTHSQWWLPCNWMRKSSCTLYNHYITSTHYPATSISNSGNCQNEYVYGTSMRHKR